MPTNITGVYCCFVTSLGGIKTTAAWMGGENRLYNGGEVRINNFTGGLSSLSVG